MSRVGESYADLSVAMTLVTGGKPDDPKAILPALSGSRRFAIVRDALSGLDQLTPADVDTAVVRLRRELRKRLPASAADIPETLGIKFEHARVLFCVLGNMTISEAVNELQLGIAKSTASRWMQDAASALVAWISRYDGHLAQISDQAELVGYLQRLRDYCSELPPWFPDDLRFADILQEVTVIPPLADNAPDGPTANPGLSGLDRETTVNGPRRLAWTAVLQEFQRLVLVGEAGSGKSWAVKGRALALAEARLSGETGTAIPILVQAAQLEELLEQSLPPGDSDSLAERIAAAVPGEILADSAYVPMLVELLRAQVAIEILVDGYDEIRHERPRLARNLEEIIRLLHPRQGRLVLTSRPATLPQHQFAKLAAVCELQPFAEREQRQFIRCWFSTQSEKGSEVLRWVTGHNPEILRKPLLIALFCAVAGTEERPLPQSEHDLWSRALRRLASEEDRYAELHQSSEIVRLRLRALEAAAGLFRTDAGLLDNLRVSQVTDGLRSLAEWADLERITAHHTVIDDLVATGIVRRVAGRHEDELSFLHSSIRDYLLAHELVRAGNWQQYVRFLWSQPEWAPVISHIGALSDRPDDVILDLETFFHDDPLNAARFTAGQIVVAAGDRVGTIRRGAVRDELLILLGSGDPIDRTRSVQLLAALQDDETSAMVRRLVDPAVPTHVVTAALRTIAGGTSAASRATLLECIGSDEFTIPERKAAVDALADTGTSEALRDLTALAEDEDANPSIRAAAAYSALRLFDSTDAARSLLASTDEASEAARRLLAERLAQAERAGSFPPGRFEQLFPVQDPYCRAILLKSSSMQTLAPALMAALPANPRAEWLAEMIEVIRRRLGADPLLATCARFMLDPAQSPRSRFRLAVLVEKAPENSASALWHALTSQVSTEDEIEIALFLHRELRVLPEEICVELHRAIDADELSPTIRKKIQDLVNPTATAKALPERTALPATDDADPQLGIDEALRIEAPLISIYAYVRFLRRTIPDEGSIRAEVASLTHAVSCQVATSWIDAQPAVAPRVDDRLSASSHPEARVELARLRSRWPGRHGEVAYSAHTFSPQVLDARAEAALLTDELDEAATLALASVGARVSEQLAPTPLAGTVLFAAGAGLGRTYSTLKQVQGYLPRGQDTAADIAVLRAWLHAATLNLRSVAQTIEALPRHVIRTDAEIAGLRMATGLAGPEAYAHVISWSGCLRSAALLAAVGKFLPPPGQDERTGTGPLRERLKAAGDVATLRAENLARDWPEIFAASPARLGTPKWTEVLLNAALKELNGGRPEVAAAIYEAIVGERPSNPALVNNLGFCQVQLDTQTALSTLERAAGLFMQPYGVNVANRMLLHLMHGNPLEADRIGDDYWRNGKMDVVTGYLWNIDEPSRLERNVDIKLYIAELGRRSALQLHDYDKVDVWASRITLHSKSTEQDVDDVD
ncbi:NACHT domain-containing protein [Micromonospora sp. WMMD967]|uniref:NACHT domain-containing protein n=1 Tax=Micromonospora sp. WMMD967 TaxID=3016101 RepID=UPI00241769ED|nr:NACHT domain-containing protein [Micromonospora sp. WMMD967]MDG4838283.1 NACHT domain-containing protein [Micromonospora sp. WMMD967]